MRRACLIGLLALAGSVTEAWAQLGSPPSAPMTPQKSEAECGVLAGTYLRMGVAQFSQRREGVREIANKPGCETAAADLVRQYRDSVLSQIEELTGIEAGLRAAAGDTENGVMLFREDLARQQDDDIKRLADEARIAFLEGDREKLVEARDRLAALPKPPNFAAKVEAARKMTGNPDFELTWPSSLLEVDSLIRCFGKSYKLASVYGCNEEWAARKEKADG